MYSKEEFIAQVLAGKSQDIQTEKGSAYAPANIALCKYWGKRDALLNLPLTSSLSVSLAHKGSHFDFEVIDEKADRLSLNNHPVEASQDFYQRLFSFINLFRRHNEPRLNITVTSTIPIAAGLASSASGFASVVKGLNVLYDWQLSCRELSLLARLGSGSACRSLWHGFVEWQKGSRDDGMDSLGVPIDIVWPQLRIGLLLASSDKKSISSREAMAVTKQSSPFYALWPQQVETDLAAIKQALVKQDFCALGEASERNALAMHATMLTATPAVLYSNAQTISWMQQIWQLRKDHMAIYFTQDAGPNLKLLFLEENTADMVEIFPEMEIIQPFSNTSRS